jgi:hypothetical protein
MVAIPSSRRFQFRLRTLLIFITVFCVVVGWGIGQVRMVRERKSLLDHAIAFGGFYVTGDMEVRANRQVGWSDLYISLAPSTVHPTIPQFRGWLGDEAIGVIGIPSESPRLEELKAAFPEATFSILKVKN